MTKNACMRFYRRPHVSCVRDLQSSTIVFSVRDELAEANTQDKNGYYQVCAYLEIWAWKYSLLLGTSTLTWISFPTCGRLDVCKCGVCGSGLNRDME